jgi:hypothetical protein
MIDNGGGCSDAGSRASTQVDASVDNMRISRVFRG